MSTTQKVAFVTGANRGIGLETVRQLVARDVTVLLGSRDLAAGEAEAKKLKGVTALKFDINSPADHKTAALFIEKEFGHLDILVNNAGIGIDFTEYGSPGNASTVSQETLRQTFDANFFNVVGLTQTLLPLIRKSSAGRIVNLSSILGSLTVHSLKESPIAGMKAFAYDASKTALNAFTVHLAWELRDTKIKVNSAHPGWVKTELGGPGAQMEIVDGAKTSVALALLDDKGATGGFVHLGETLPW